MSLAFLSLLLQCFISLRCCPKQKSVLLLPGATGDPQPIAKKGTRWASPPLDFTESSAPCTKVSNALCVPLYQGLVTFGHRKQSCLLPSSDSCEDRRSACSLLGIASLRTGEKTDGTHSCVAFFWDADKLNRLGGLRCRRAAWSKRCFRRCPVF